MKRWHQWLRSCPLWCPPPQHIGIDLHVTPTVFNMELKNTWPQGVPIDQVELYNTIKGSLLAEWDGYDPEVAETSSFRIILHVPADANL